MTTMAPLLGEPLPVELMNTVWADRDGVHDALADADGLADWLTTAGVAGGEAAALHDFRALRDALRTLAAEVTDDTRPVAVQARDVPRAVDTINRACAATPSWSRLDWAERRVERITSGNAALSTVAEAAAALFGSDQRTELRACYAPGCVLYFVRDHPRRQWCSAGCGNRARVARHYARHHTA
jgi:predicted RNA-binding Zn ribbon-like protein